MEKIQTRVIETPTILENTLPELRFLYPAQDIHANHGNTAGIQCDRVFNEDGFHGEYNQPVAFVSKGQSVLKYRSDGEIVGFQLNGNPISNMLDALPGF